ncbi:MAG TPA: hypothetical protein VK112_06485 [Fodinibius sp.]|nr:hypothetical protein [Fodinibius sp.]
MNAIGYILIVAIVIWGLWFTYSKFRVIEKGTSKRQKRIDEDMRVRKKRKQDDDM